jgi:hypothetical protein
MEIQPPLDIGYLVKLHNKSPDVFYKTILDLDIEDLLSLCKSNKELNNLICRGKGRNIWIPLWRKNLSEEVPDVSIDELRKRYIKAMKETKHLFADRLLNYAANKGYEKLIPSAYEKLIGNKYVKHDLTYALSLAIRRNHYLVVKELLKYKEAKDAVIIYYDLLRDAIETENLDIIQALINAGANLNRSIMEYSPSLNRAAQVGNIDVVRLLLENGSTQGLKPPYGDFYPALLIAIKKDIDIARLLVQYGADIPSAIALADFPKERAILEDLSLERSGQSDELSEGDT